MGGSTQSLLNSIKSVEGKVKPIVLFMRDGIACKLFREHGIECIVFPYVKLHLFPQNNRWWQLLRHPRRIRFVRLFLMEKACVKYVKNYLSGRHVDIVHSNYSSLLIGRELSIALKTKHVWHIREFLEKGVHVKNRPFGGYFLLKALINRADARIFVSHQAQAHWGLKQKNSWVIPCPIASASDSCYNSEKEPFILFCSYHVTRAKGALLAVNAFGKSGLFTEGIRLTYVGNCTDQIRSEILNVARNYGCGSAIDFVPCQNNVKPYFSQAKAFIMASVDEGLGRVTAEAMFYGCPVLALDSGGTKDLIKNHETGDLFRSENECGALLQQVCHTSQEPMIRRAQDFAMSNLTIEVHGPRLMQVYNAVLCA